VLQHAGMHEGLLVQHASCLPAFVWQKYCTHINLWLVIISEIVIYELFIWKCQKTIIISWICLPWSKREAVSWLERIQVWISWSRSCEKVSASRTQSVSWQLIGDI
jgi:hypothetical protein